MKNLTSLIEHIAFLANLGDISVSENVETDALTIETCSAEPLIGILLEILSGGNVKELGQLPIDKSVTFEFSSDLTVIFTRKF